MILQLIDQHGNLYREHEAVKVIYDKTKLLLLFSEKKSKFRKKNFDHSTILWYTCNLPISIYWWMIIFQPSNWLVWWTYLGQMIWSFW